MVMLHVTRRANFNRKMGSRFILSRMLPINLRCTNERKDESFRAKTSDVPAERHIAAIPLTRGVQARKSYNGEITRLKHMCKNPIYVFLRLGKVKALPLRQTTLANGVISRYRFHGKLLQLQQ